jgi:hypothetical protein
LRIPWNEIQLERSKRFWCNYIVLILGNEEKVPLRISERMAHKLGILERIPEASGLSAESNFETLSDSFVASQMKKPD